MFPLALPSPSIEIKTTLMLGAVVAPIAVTPAVIGAVMLGTAEGPHVVQGPNNRLADAGNIGNREHLALHPVQIQYISIGGIDQLRPPMGPAPESGLSPPVRSSLRRGIAN